MRLEEVMKELRNRADEETRKKAEKFGIQSQNSYGVSISELRDLAEEIENKIEHSHPLALDLWNKEVLEARELAAIIDDPEKVTEDQMERWVRDFDSWALCDLVCQDLFSRTDLAEKKIKEWTSREEEFVKRAGFSLIAKIALYDKESPDKKFENYFKLIKRESDDDRKYVKKALSWALREIGKRNKNLNRKTIELAKDLREKNSRSAQWIASDVLKELRSEKVQERFEQG